MNISDFKLSENDRYLHFLSLVNCMHIYRFTSTFSATHPSSPMLLCCSLRKDSTVRGCGAFVFLCIILNTVVPHGTVVSSTFPNRSATSSITTPAKKSGNTIFHKGFNFPLSEGLITAIIMTSMSVCSYFNPNLMEPNLTKPEDYTLFNYLSKQWVQEQRVTHYIWRPM